MVLKYIKEEALLTLKRNKVHIYDLMKNSSSNSWVEEYLGKDCFAESKIAVKDFKLDTSFDKPIEGDFENAKILFTALKNLNETQATDERLWAGLAFGQCYDYLIHRWGLDNITRLKYRWFYYTEYKRKLFYHGLSRLWWFAYMTYDESLSDPFELTEYAYRYPQIMKAMTYRNYSNSRKIRNIIIKTLKRFEEIGGIVNTRLIDETYKFVSLIGSASIIDAYDDEEMEFLLIDFFKKNGQIK